MTKRNNPRKPTDPKQHPVPGRNKAPKVIKLYDPSDKVTDDQLQFDAGIKGMLAATRRRCGTCRNFYLSPSAVTGECRMESPQADLEDGGKAVWPHGIDPDTGWCGAGYESI